jgi:WhiB family redox-sensing transcriptional regulator
MTRIRLAEGVWIVPKQHRGYGPPAWMKGGLCTQLDTTESDPLFFGVERRKAPGQLIAASNIAKLICKQCPVRATCLTNALVNDERYGVWGGTSGRQRAKLRTRLSKGAGVGELVSECLDKAGA